MAKTAAYKAAKTDIKHTADTKSSGEPAEQEKWLYNNPEALADVRRGLADSAAGRGVKMSFLEFADIDIED